MSTSTDHLSRRALLRAASASAAVAVTDSALGSPAFAVSTPAESVPVGAKRLFRDLDQKIEAGMARYAIPGVAVGVLYQGTEYVKGYGVTNVD